MNENFYLYMEWSKKAICTWNRAFDLQCLGFKNMSNRLYIQAKLEHDIAMLWLDASV